MKEFDAKDIVSQDVDMRAYINKLLDDIRKDIEVYEIIKKLNLTIGEVRENIAKLTDFKEDYNYCKNCPGVDACDKRTPHIAMRVEKEGNYITTQYEPCQKIMEQIKLDSRYLFKDFPSEWKSSTMRTLDLSINRRPAMKEFQKILSGDSERWLYVTGNHKVGKSFLLVTFANEFAASGLGQVAVVNCLDRIKKLSDLSYEDKEEFTRQIVALSKVPLLILDGFGEEYKNEYIRDQIILPILSEREHSSRLTFFTSDFTIKEIQQMYSIGKSGGEIRGKQLAKILSEMCDKEFDLTGAAIYKKK